MILDDTQLAISMLQLVVLEEDIQRPAPRKRQELQETRDNLQSC